MTVGQHRAGIPADAPVAAFPLGGIGTGTVSVGARGQLQDWEIFNSPGRGNVLPFTFFAIHAQRAGAAPVSRVLESRLRPPHGERPYGYLWWTAAGLPRLQDSVMHGEYPLVRVAFLDESLPVSVALEAFTPLIPLNAKESGIPGAVLRYRVHNPGDKPVTVTVAGSLANAVGFEPGTDGLFLPKFAGQPRNAYRDDGNIRGLWYTSSLPTHDIRHGTMALATAAQDVTAKPEWLSQFHHGFEEFWSDFSSDGRLSCTADDTAGEKNGLRVGSLAITADLEPGGERDFEFILAWHFPARPKGWPQLGGFAGVDPYSGQSMRNFYATWLSDAWDTAMYLHRNLPRLERDTRAFHESLFSSSLPPEILDAAAANIAVLRSNTCFRLEDGTLVSWEGTADHAGSWPGSCTHVWNYAQTVAYLFPELERSMRRVEFQLETDPDGRMNFRVNRVFGGPALWEVVTQNQEQQKLPAVDGQLGTIVRLYRDWRFSGDTALITDLWSHAKRALEFAIDQWDTEGDHVLRGPQHTTYDIELYGPNSLSSSLFYAALRAGAEMAAYLGEDESAERYRQAAERGAETMDRMLWNGEYYIQDLPHPDAQPYQYGTGCLSDQVFGQMLAHISGLGRVLPVSHTRQALAAVYRHNFRKQLFDHHHTQVTYALDDEGGLLLCSWPHGGRPRQPLIYCDQVWTGVEYQVATHMIYEGMIAEALEIVRTARARHDGYRRNPWNEVEAGHHYVRSMSSWGLVLAYTGMRYDGVTRTLAFAPGGGERQLRTFFSTSHGWGTYCQNESYVRLEVAYGRIALQRLRFPCIPNAAFDCIAVNGRRSSATSIADEKTVSLDIPSIELRAGDVLEAFFAPPDQVAGQGT
ncbi:GH116 family glycosyl-hydrolase [Amycolatopsis thermoflava]|uniref:GH116 family glycosyl-hydrolase n=1 Tax=Amycolatopsis thermoflava TaxID=84480 RepID=UPI003D7036D3